MDGYLLFYVCLWLNAIRMLVPMKRTCITELVAVSVQIVVCCRRAAEHHQAEAVGSTGGVAGEVWVGSRGGHSLCKLPRAHAVFWAGETGDGLGLPAAPLAQLLVPAPSVTASHPGGPQHCSFPVFIVTGTFCTHNLRLVGSKHSKLFDVGWNLRALDDLNLFNPLPNTEILTYLRNVIVENIMKSRALFSAWKQMHHFPNSTLF